MRAIIGGKLDKIDGQKSPVPLREPETQQNQAQLKDRNVRPVTRINGSRIHFRDLARMAFPEKTESNLAFLARVEARTARRWLADDNEPPAEVLGIILAEIMKRFHQR